MKQIWNHVDKMHSPLEWSGVVEEILRFLVHACTTMKCSANVATELRMTFTQPSFGLKSIVGWISAIATVALMVGRFRKQLFSEFMEKISEKCCGKFELKACYIIALIGLGTNVPPNERDSLLNTLSLRDLLATYPDQVNEGRDLVELAIKALVVSPLNSIQPPAILPVLACILGCFCPPPSELTESILYKLNSKFSKSVSEYIGSHAPSLLIQKGGGFLPRTDPGLERIDFGKHRGMPFHQLLKDKGFCDWTERIPDPSSAAFIQWLDYILANRQISVVGPRTIRGDIELIRLEAGQSMETKIDLWLASRALAAKRSLDIYSSSTAPDFIPYAESVYEICRRLTSFSESLDLEPLKSIKRPRGEIIKELYRPIVKLGTLVPSMKSQISDCLIAVRALCHNCSLEEARSELVSIHSLPL